MSEENLHTRFKFRYVAVAWAFLETFLLSGYYAGWASLVYILKKEGMYSFLCHSNPQIYANDTIPSYPSFTQGYGNNLYLSEEHKVSLNVTFERGMTMEDEDTGCPEQDAMFELCFTIWSIVSTFVALVMGHINFAYGIRTTRVVSITMLVIGSAMFAVISKDTPWMMFIGYLALANGGMGILQTNNQVSYMFEKGGPTVIGLICGAFDASGSVMLGVKLAYENGVSLQMSFIVIGCFNIMAVISTFTFLPQSFIQNTQTNSDTDADIKAILCEGENHTSLKNKTKSTEKTMLLRGKNIAQPLHKLRPEAKESHPVLDTYPTAAERNREPTKGEVSGIKEDKESSRNSLLLGYICSPLYMLTLLWACVIQLIFVFFIGSFNAWLEHITHHVHARVSLLTDFMFTVMLASPVVSILSGAMVDFFYSIQPEKWSHKARTHYALAAPIALTNFLAVTLCACVVVESEDMTYVTAIASVLYRTLLYTGLTLFSRLLYPSEYFAAIYGVLFMVSGLANFLQYPLFLWCQSSPSGYRQVYGTLGLASILISVQPIYLIYTGYREMQ